MNQGDRLAFSNGILVLSVFAAVLIIVFRGDTQLLLPLYMIGVFVSFTLSQAGMVIHWRKTKEAGWKTSAVVNGFGAVVTGIVLVIVAVTKTLEGAWIVLLLIPLIVAVFKSTRQHYDHVASQLTLRGYEPEQRAHNTVVMPIGGMQRAVVEALALRGDAVRRRACGLCRYRSESDRADQERLGQVGRTGHAGRPSVAVPLGDGAAARRTSRRSKLTGRTTT